MKVQSLVFTELNSDVQMTGIFVNTSIFVLGSEGASQLAPNNHVGDKVSKGNRPIMLDLNELSRLSPWGRNGTVDRCMGLDWTLDVALLYAAAGRWRAALLITKQAQIMADELKANNLLNRIWAINLEINSTRRYFDGAIVSPLWRRLHGGAASTPTQFPISDDFVKLKKIRIVERLSNSTHDPFSQQLPLFSAGEIEYFQELLQPQSRSEFISVIRRLSSKSLLWDTEKAYLNTIACSESGDFDAAIINYCAYAELYLKLDRFDRNISESDLLGQALLWLIGDAAGNQIGRDATNMPFCSRALSIYAMQQDPISVGAVAKIMSRTVRRLQQAFQASGLGSPASVFKRVESAEVPNRCSTSRLSSVSR